MKKFISVLLCVAIMLSVAGCSIGTKKGEIGQTYTSSTDVEFTLNTVAFAEVIDGWGGANDDFWKPLDENNCNIGSGKRWDTVEKYALEHGLKPKSDDDRIVFVSYTAKNVSKNDMVIKEVGTLNYDNGYKYSEGALACRFSDGMWNELPGGINVKKLDETAYEFRAYMVVPKQVVESDKALTYLLFGYEFEIR